MTPSATPINFVFLSCHFPPRFRFFAQRLADKGVTVLGIADETFENLHWELRDSLTEYYRVPDLEDYDQIYRAIAYFTHKYGRIQFIESLNEHWLETEARLRKDFNVEGGYRPKEMSIYKRKSGMKKCFTAAGLKAAPGLIPSTMDEAKEFARKTGFPMIMKPDIGVGASGAKKLHDEAELAANWQPGYFIEKFIEGHMETYDGLCDENGNVVFYSSLRYASGTMDLINGSCESLFFYVVKDVPEDLRILGDISVKAFNLKSRFFHLETFRTKEGLLPLEMNLRPPGVITVDLWNYTHQIDIYAEYANVITKQPVTPYQKAKAYGTYSGRRDIWNYKNSHEDVVNKLGKRLEFTYAMPAIFSPVMGNFAYLFTSDSVEEMRQGIELIETRVHQESAAPPISSLPAPVVSTTPTPLPSPLPCP